MTMSASNPCGPSAPLTAMLVHAPHLSLAAPAGIGSVGWVAVVARRHKIGLISRIGIDPRVAATLAGSHLHVAEPHWPSVHSAPVQTRRNSVVPAMYFLKRGSST